MKTLIVYYSFEGNTRFVAEKMATAVEAQRLDLKLEKELKTHSFVKYLWGGQQVMMKKRPALQPFELDVQDYDLVLLGTPVWAGTYAPALATFFDTVSFSGKRVGLFCCYAGSAGKTFDRMIGQLEGNTILGQISFRDPLKHDTEGSGSRAAEWAGEMVRAAEGT